MEVAALAKPIVVGPHTQNFAETMNQLERHNAIRILKSDLESPGVVVELADTIAQLLEDSASAQQMAENGREVVVKNRGATERTLEALMEILKSA